MERSGQQLGTYRLVRLLSRSEEADTYLGEHTFLNTPSVIKIFQVHLLEQETLACQQEARGLADLAHPNIVRVLDFGVEEKQFFLVTEYIPGDTLDHTYPFGKRLTPASAISLIKPIANALQYAHDRNVVHGSVRPENILLGRENEVLLSNFGISPIMQAMRLQATQPDTRSLFSLAPEVYDGKLQRSSDQYALAAIAYTWLSGEHLPVRAASLSEKVPGIPPEVDLVLHRAMQEDPTRRFSSISEFSRDLARACKTTSVDLTATSSAENPGWSATLPAASLPLPAPQGLDAMYQQPETPSSLVPTWRNPGNTPYPDPYPDPYYPDPYHVQPAWNAPPAERRAQGNHPTRRALLASLGAGTIVLGGAVALGVSGKLTPVFAWISATLTHRSNQGSTLPPSAVQESATPGSNFPPGVTFTTFTGQSSDVTGVCWLPVVNSRVVATCSLDGSASIWNALTGQTTGTFPEAGELSTLAWSPNGQYIAFGGADEIVEIWDATSMNLIARCTGHTEVIRGLAWSPNSQQIVSTSQDHTAIVWEAATGSQLTTFTGHTDYVWVASWSPDGRSIATGSWDKTVQIWSPDTGALILRYNAPHEVRAVDWSPDSSMIASGGDGNSVEVWQAANGSIQAIYNGHYDHIEAVQWSPDGQSIASASKDTTVQIWQAVNANHIYTYRGHTQLVWALSWSPDGQLIISGSQDQTARVWQAV